MPEEGRPILDRDWTLWEQQQAFGLVSLLGQPLTLQGTGGYIRQPCGNLRGLFGPAGYMTGGEAACLVTDNQNYRKHEGTENETSYHWQPENRKR